MEKYIHIGKIVATHGVAGEMLLQHSLGNKLTFKEVKAIFVEEQKNSLLPHFIATAKAKDDTITILQLEKTTSRERAQRFLKKNVHLLESDFEKLVDKNAPISLLGFDILNDEILLGEVEEIIEQPHQLLLKTTYQGKEVLIPVHEATLKGIDHQKRLVSVSLPEGLLDIYLSQ